MNTRFRHIIFFLLPFIACSCQKEIDPGSTDPAVAAGKKPKVGTTWTYRYLTYNIAGGLAGNITVTHKAKEEVMLGGEKWLNIVDMGPDTTVYYLNVKTGGLYQYTSNSSNLLCKYPASLNDTYTAFNEGASENFIVKGVKDTLPTGIGDVPANYYEGTKGAYLIDLIWYNENAWIVRKTQYRNRSLVSPFYYRYYTYYLDNITY